VKALATLAMLPVLASGPEPAAEPGPSLTGEAGAVMAELKRGLDGLRLEESPAPYYGEVRLVRAEMLTLDGSYGGLITDLHEKQAVGSLSVKVGSPAQGSGGFFGPSSDVSFVLSLAPDAESTRKKVWLGMDGAFRGATSAFNAKQAVLARLAGDPPPPELSEGPKPFVDVKWTSGDTKALEPPRPNVEIDRDQWGALVTRLSAKFEGHPTIDNGDVMFLFMRSHELLVTTEGVVRGQARDRAVLAVVADTQAPDGMRLDHGLAIHFQNIPSPDESVEKRGEQLVEQVLAQLEELAAAPMIEEDYDGPVLFSPTAGAQLLATTVAVHATGEPAPLSDYGRVTELEPHWQDRLGKGVMPEWLDLVDDPLADGFGHYTVDAEGMPAQKLSVVKAGKLSDLFMTRVPNEYVDRSNGHARASPALGIGPAMSNLSLRSHKRGLDSRSLERELLRRAREDGYEFAYVIESLRDGNVLGAVPRESAIIYAGGRKVSLPIPGRVYRLDQNGKKTLVRGSLLSPASMRVLRRIRAVGRQSEAVPMRIAPGLTGGFTADVGVDALLAQTVDVEVTTPALLIDGFELLVERGEHERLPTLVHPLRREAAKSE
jgi:hypothetical protein